MEDTENTFISQIPQLTRHAALSPQRGLSEISSSLNNSRNGSMLPPPINGHKRQGSQLPEPNSKRKTLAERAGESFKSSLTAPKFNAAAYSAIAAANTFRNQPSSSSESYRSASITSNASTTSNASRITSNSSLSMSVGSGIRPPAALPTSTIGRPKTSLAKERSTKMTITKVNTANGARMLERGNKNTIRKAPTLESLRSDSSFRVTSLALKQKHSPAFSNGRQENPAPVSSDWRNTSLVSAFENLNVNADQSGTTPSQSPSKIPKLMTPISKPKTNILRKAFSPPPFPKPSPSKTPQRRDFLTKYSDVEAWDPEEQYSNMERMYQDVCSHYKEAMEDNVEAKETVNVYKSSITRLEEERSRLSESVILLRSELESTKYCLSAAERAREDTKRDGEEEVENVKRQFRLEIESIRQAHRDDLERLKSDHREEVRDVKRRLEEDLDSERTQRIHAMSQLSTQGLLDKQKQQIELESKEQEIRSVKAEVDRINAGLERERTLNDDLRENLSAAASNAASMEAARQALQAKIDYLESDSKSQSEAYAEMERRMNEAIIKANECEEKLRKEETLRRKLHNQVQELKGNIRVFCRVRPLNPNTQSEETARITFPDIEDSTEIEVKGAEETSSLGKTTTKSYPFSFDRVFDQSCNNAEVFDEISQLIQSALDGYNVCIFAYGQTGSGKTFTMSAEDGMIPRALRQIYSTSRELESRGWKYTMEGSFIEVYNEEIRDLLGKEGESATNKKHEIRHDMVKCETTIVDVTTVSLDSQDQVEGLLSQAMARRSVAATKANERSSRSHSVFILKLQGTNTITGERSKGTLNLVDLAGSERLSQSKVNGERLKETQHINKSLSCLGDVIGALGSSQQQQESSSTQQQQHIPYRNSKLTYLLQFSLGGNSKTLMFVMVAPEKKCLAETITSLKFADKVSKTKIGVAKKVGK